MAVIKLIATDLDNTLLDRGGNVTDECVSAIRRAQDKGVRFAVATGRSYRSAKAVTESIGGSGYAICYNGSQIRRIENDSMFFSARVSDEVARGVVDIARENGYYLQMYDNDVIVVEKLRLDMHPDPDLKFTEHREIGDFETLFDAEGHLTIETPKILLATDPEAVPEIQKGLEERFAGKAYFAQSESHLIEIMPFGINKGGALDMMAAEFGLSRDEIMALGDNTNDRLLLEHAGLAVAVANAVPSLKEVADYVCEGERDKGFCEALEKFVL